MSASAVILIDPKYDFNVGGALRACAAFGAQRLIWTGSRVPSIDQWPEGTRLPREERIKDYKNVKIGTGAADDAPISILAGWGYTPVAVEVRENAEPLDFFVHPDKAVYVFGPEDSGLEREEYKGTLHVCHRFVCIPSNGCINLAAAVYITLYDRLSKERHPREPTYVNPL